MSKVAYFKQEITQSVTNPKALWLTLMAITGENIKKSNASLQISLQSSLISDREKIANAFNDYFVICQRTCNQFCHSLPFLTLNTRSILFFRDLSK